MPCPSVGCSWEWRAASALDAHRDDCPLYRNNSVIEPLQRSRFACHLHDASTPQRHALARCPASSSRPGRTIGTVYLVGDSLDFQLGKALACRLWRHHTKHAALAMHFEMSTAWMRTLDRGRPHPSRGTPWCIRIGPSTSKRTNDTSAVGNETHVQATSPARVCALSAHPNSLATAERLAAMGVAHPGDVIVVSARMGERQGEGLDLARALAHKLQGMPTAPRRGRAERGGTEPDGERGRGGSPLAQAHAAGVSVIWRERSPQSFSDSATGSYSAHTYGRPTQTCSPQRQTERSANHTAAIAAVRAAGIPAMLLWDVSVTQWDTHLARRTPYVRSRLDCTHWCEPSGVLEAWVDVALAALGDPAVC
mgnify:CR=1 FL=1